MRSLELFTGCGGLALGLSQAGFGHALVAERDANAVATLRLNQEKGTQHFRSWPLSAGDVRDIDFAQIGSSVDLVSGGPPCQPFSIGGKHKGPSDERNMWPEAIRAVQELQPKVFLFENVRGLLRPAFADYLHFLTLQLASPDSLALGRSWERRLPELRKQGQASAYHVVFKGINAADYGAPQKRHRAIVMGIRSDIASCVEFPAITHSREALIWDQWVTGDYWERHGISKRMRPQMEEAEKRIYERLVAAGIKPKEKPWVTVRDTIADLPKPNARIASVPNHLLHPGARIYVGHTGSGWDQPAKALKAGAHGVPGGENVLVDYKGNVRYFTIREMMRLQGFPDSFRMETTWASAIKQLGNAVPVQVGRAFGVSLRRQISRVKRVLPMQKATAGNLKT